MSPEAIGKIAALVARKNSGQSTERIAEEVGIEKSTLHGFFRTLKACGVPISRPPGNRKGCRLSPEHRQALTNGIRKYHREFAAWRAEQSQRAAAE